MQAPSGGEENGDDNGEPRSEQGVPHRQCASRIPTKSANSLLRPGSFLDV